ncbi:unnamed protein product [Durusdinium trenchii]|uniref:Calmodulin n=1 Tax=Durusdinium trenchii TaxID=1381693 RepID=A0ABP0HCE2_9DINO
MASLSELAKLEMANFRINPRESISGEVLSSLPATPRILSSVVANRWKDIKPSNSSMYETALQLPNKRLPALERLESVKESLRRDEARQYTAYSGSSLKNTVPMPGSPQHKKFCCDMTGLPTLTLSGKSQKDSKHSVKTLERIFERLAEPHAISHRKFLASMFQDQELASVVEKFTAGLHVPKTDDENAFQEAKRKAIVKKILGILKEVDKDSSGSTEWDEFLEFFRKAECLLEYRSEKARNRTALHEEVEALRSRQHDDPPEVEKDIRQKASNVGRRASFRLQMP